jgi:hypothetical protein
MKIKEIFFSFDIINKFVVNALNENINCNMYNIVNNLNQIDKKESKKQNFYINDIIEILDIKNNWNIKENNNPFIINKIDNFYSIVKNDFNDNNNINNNFHNKLNKIFIGSKNFEIKNNNNNININKNNNLNKSINYYINNNNNFNTINYDQNTKTIDINNKHKIKKNVKDSIKKNLSPVLNNLNKTKVFDVTGAGDTVIASYALALTAGLKPEIAALIGNIAASIVIRTFGCATTTLEEISSNVDKINL